MLSTQILAHPAGLVLPEPAPDAGGHKGLQLDHEALQLKVLGP
jgi:hypothetical protein